MEQVLILPYEKIGIKDVSIVGGKNASLGEMMQQLKPLGVNIPEGFATTAEAFNLFLKENNFREKLKAQINSLDCKNFTNLNEVSLNMKQLITSGLLPQSLTIEIIKFYEEMCKRYKRDLDVAVRSSATAEDLPNASFAGLHESYLNVKGVENICKAVLNCFASMYNARAIKYRIDNHFDHNKIALSVGIQLMVRSDKASSGVCFTIDPESGFKNMIVITSCWGLGENIVQGAVTPDEFYVFKPFIGKQNRVVISKKIGSKTKTLIYNLKGNGTINTETTLAKQKQITLNDNEIEKIANWSLLIENHYKMPMDIEWAKDGNSQEIYIVQARPETVHAQKEPLLVKEFKIKKKGNLLVTGNSIGTGITSGIARIIDSPAEAYKLNRGDVLVTDITNPDWDPILKKAVAIITNKGGRTSHAAIVAREVGAIAIVGANNATTLIKEGDVITIDNSQGKNGFVYLGKAEWTEKELDFRNIKMSNTQPMLILSDPDKAFKYSFYPNKGVGLMRLEFVIANTIRIHPMALVKFDELTDNATKKQIEELTNLYSNKNNYFIDMLSQAVGTIAAAFYPKDVVVRMSDFKSNEYANLIGGKQFEIEEENPMIGFRGASRYYNERYKEGFKLECEAMKIVRDEMGFTNVKLMIPFCRTVEEGKKVLELMDSFGLKRGLRGLEIYVMAEIPSNIILAEKFAEVFDGFSIGSNDLTQLTLGIDRDSNIISDLFDETNPAVLQMIEGVIKAANKSRKKIGLCGQAPSDNPSFAEFLIKCGINSISYNPDSLLKGIENMNKAELIRTNKLVSV